MRRKLLTLCACLTGAGTAAAGDVPAAVAAMPVEMPAATTATGTGVVPATASMVYSNAPEAGTCSTDTLCFTPRAWIGADYMVMYISPMNTPGLIQVVPSANAVVGGALVPTAAATKVFPEDRQLTYDAFQGVRLRGGIDFDKWGIEASGFSTQTNTQSGAINSDGTSLAVGRQYFNAATGANSTLYSSLPGANGYSGGIGVQVDSQIWGAEINYRTPGYTFLADRVDYLAGYRTLNLSEGIVISDVSNFPGGIGLHIVDVIRTRNQFNGAQIGFQSHAGAVERGLGVEGGFKIGLGSMRQEISMGGSNTYYVGGIPDPQAGGFYAQGANAGLFTRERIATVSELNLGLTYKFTRNVQISFGYNLIYASSVIRPGEAIDPSINENQVRYISNPTPTPVLAPYQRWNANDFWVQGMTFGATLMY